MRTASVMELRDIPADGRQVTRPSNGPGHESPDVLSYTCSPAVPRDPGRTNPQDIASRMGDLQTKIFDRLPDETWFYPGHGKDSALGNERPAIPEWRARGW